MNSGINEALEWSEILIHLFSIVPISSIEVLMISPSFKHLPWEAPTPDGVPVKIKSPVCRVKNSDMYEMIWGISNIKSFVLSFWRNSSFT